MRAYVRKRKRELGLGIAAYVPQHHEVARSAEVDSTRLRSNRFLSPG